MVVCRRLIALSAIVVLACAGARGVAAGAAMIGGAFELTGGFWPGLLESVASPGDCNREGDIALDDHAGFPPCMLGPDNGVQAGCDNADLDGSGIVDLASVYLFQQLFTGAQP